MKNELPIIHELNLKHDGEFLSPYMHIYHRAPNIYFIHNHEEYDLNNEYSLLYKIEVSDLDDFLHGNLSLTTMYLRTKACFHLIVNKNSSKQTLSRIKVGEISVTDMFFRQSYHTDYTRSLLIKFRSLKVSKLLNSLA